MYFNSLLLCRWTELALNAKERDSRFFTASDCSADYILGTQTANPIMTSPYRQHYPVNLSASCTRVLGSRQHAELISTWKFAVRPGRSLLQVLSGCLNQKCSLYLLFQVFDSPRLLWVRNLLVCSIATSLIL